VGHFASTVAFSLQACSEKGGFETRYIHRYGTSLAKINVPPQSRGRFQTCPVLRQALNLPFLKGSWRKDVPLFLKRCTELDYGYPKRRGISDLKY
jgi:hypothetical protein